MSLISNKFRTIAVDTPGFGMSACPPTPYTIPEYAGIVVEFLDQLGVETTHVFGHHTGTCLAVELAITIPDRIESLILSGPICLDEKQRGERLMKRPSFELDDDGNYLKDVWDFLSLRQQGNSLDLISRHRELVWRLKAGVEAINARTAVFNYDLAGKLPLIQSRSLVLRGEEDIMKDSAEHAVRYLTDVVMHTIAGAQNWFEYNSHQKVAELVLEFLREN